MINPFTKQYMTFLSLDIYKNIFINMHHSLPSGFIIFTCLLEIFNAYVHVCKLFQSAKKA